MAASFRPGSDLNDQRRALSLRYGDQPQRDILWNDTIAHLLSHRSVRAYVSAPLPDNLVETLAAVAQSAANSSNQQSWSVVAVTDPDRKAELAQLAGGQRHILEAPLLLVWVADLARAEAIATAAGGDFTHLERLDSFMVATIDASLAAQNAVTAAESLGLGTVYIGGMRNRPEDVAEVLNLPSRSVALFAVVVGWPDPQRVASVKPRLPQDAILHRETYDSSRRDDHVETYDRVSRAFQRSQGQPDVGWVEQMVKRSRSGMSGRERLREALRVLGFPLE